MFKILVMTCIENHGRMPHMSISMTVVSCTAMLLLLVSQECADAQPQQQVFVDVERGSDRSGNGSGEQPGETIQFAVEHMSPGDVCVLQASVYRETVVPRDEQTFRACETETPIVSGCDVVDCYLWHHHRIVRCLGMAQLPTSLELVREGGK